MQNMYLERYVMAKLLEFSTSPQGIAEAAQVLQSGGTVAFPTETVYGLGADATNEHATKKIYTAKGRPNFNPLIAHVADIEMVETLVEVSDTARKLMHAFWPGDLTLVLPLKPHSPIAKPVTAGLKTLAVRMPNHPIALDLLRRVQRPIAAPSANPSGCISPTTAQHVKDGLNGKIDGLIMGTPCNVGVESTILSLMPQPAILRPGGISSQTIETVIGRPLTKTNIGPAKITAPGQLTSHYAPKVAVRLNATKAHDHETLIGFGNIKGRYNLSKEGVLSEAAENLFAVLRQAETLNKPIAFAPIPDIGIGCAINDRLKRAAAPRD